MLLCLYFAELFFFLIKNDLTSSYLKVSSLQSVLASPAESGFTSESCRSFPLRSSSFRWDVPVLRTEARSAQHFWRMHSFNLQVRIRFIWISYCVCYSILKTKQSLKWPEHCRSWTDLIFTKSYKKISWPINWQLQIYTKTQYFCFVHWACMIWP